MTHTAGVSSLAVAISLPPRPPERLGLPQPYGRPACSAPVRGWRAARDHLPVTRCSRRWSLRGRSAGRSGSSGRETTSAPLRALYSRSRCSSSATARRLVLSCDEDRDLAAVLVACADLGYERRQLIGQRLDATTQPVEVRPAPADLGLALVSLPGGPLYRGFDCLDGLLHGRAQLALIVGHRLAHAADERGAQPPRVTVGHVHQPAFGVAQCHPAAEGSRHGPASEGDDVIEHVADVFELERELRRMAQVNVG